MPKRLRESRKWLYALCVELFLEHGTALSAPCGFEVRAFDAMTAPEPGPTGSQGRPRGLLASAREDWSAVAGNSG
ncbi:MAG: hypothetical protein OXB91_01715 [Bryobacterales bacterium]|nr:hypothetical protein [Bryobacterales bacterium]